jgi:hypothetical protein
MISSNPYHPLRLQRELLTHKVVRVGIWSRIDFPLIELSRRILDSTRLLIQEFILAEILYYSIEKVKIQNIKISSNMVYTNISKKSKEN